MSTGGGSLDADTVSTSDGAGVWTAEVTDHWDGANGVPNGGYLLAVALRALTQELAGPGDPVSVSALFLRPGRHGPARVVTSVDKRGRRIGFGHAVLRQEDQDIVRIQAAFAYLAGADAPTLRYSAVPAPNLPPPDECVDPLDLRSDAADYVARSVLGRLELRMPEVPGWSAGQPSGRPTMALWLRSRDGREPDPLGLVQMVDGLPPVVAELSSWSTTVELTVHIRARPEPGWLRAQVDTLEVSNGFHDEQVTVWDSAGTMVASSRQLALVLPFGTTS